jgi:hypothetical protein
MTLRIWASASGTRSGVSIGINDIDVQTKRKEILQKTEDNVRRTNRAYEDDPYSMTQQERERRVLNAWIKASQDVQNDVYVRWTNSIRST